MRRNNVHHLVSIFQSYRSQSKLCSVTVNGILTHFSPITNIAPLCNSKIAVGHIAIFDYISINCVALLHTFCFLFSYIVSFSSSFIISLQWCWMTQSGWRSGAWSRRTGSDARRRKWWKISRTVQSPPGTSGSWSNWWQRPTDTPMLRAPTGNKSANSW